MDSARPSQTVFWTGQVMVGRFRCHPSHPRFSDTGPTGGHLLVFPREPVTITHAGGRPIVADPTRVMFYNAGQEYRRGAISPAGDRCEWIGLSADAVRAASRAHAPRGAEHERPFGPLTHGPCDARSYLLARALHEHAAGPARDALLIDELALQLLDRLVARAWAMRGAPRAATRAATERAHVDLAVATRRLLAQRFADPLSLADLARLAGTSPFHLARIFRRHAGQSLHAFRTDLRVRAAAHRILGGAEDLTAIALDVGFSSHSHLSTAFRAAFGVPPSGLRRLPPAALGKLLS